MERVSIYSIYRDRVHALNNMWAELCVHSVNSTLWVCSSILRSFRTRSRVHLKASLACSKPSQIGTSTQKISLLWMMKAGTLGCANVQKVFKFLIYHHHSVILGLFSNSCWSGGGGGLLNTMYNTNCHPKDQKSFCLILFLVVTLG